MSVLGRPPYPYEGTRTWAALREGLKQLQDMGAVSLQEGERPVLNVLCRALDRAGVFSLGESGGTPVGN